MTVNELKKRILSLTDGISLVWNDEYIYIDPFSKTNIKVYYNDKEYIYTNINDLFDDDIYDDYTLTEIIKDIKLAP